jgi:uncharacterized protein YecT (DUF1311 family)
MPKNFRYSYLRYAFLLFLGGGACFAQHMNAKDGPCQAPSSGAGETQCFYDASKKADLELNQVYKRVQSVVEGDDLAKLKTVQRLWIQFRDANCDAEHELYSGGSAAPMVQFACLEAVTRHRSEELMVMYGWRLEKWSK